MACNSPLASRRPLALFSCGRSRRSRGRCRYRPGAEDAWLRIAGRIDITAGVVSTATRGMRRYVIELLGIGALPAGDPIELSQRRNPAE